MSSEPKDGARVRMPPPLVFLAAALLGALMERQVIALPLAGAWTLPVGILCLVLGALLIALAMRLFFRSGQDPEPWKPTPSIVAAGIFRWTRNPMYVGMALLQIGAGVLKGYGWIVLTVPLSLWLVYLTAVRHEEEYLTGKFGDEYLRYRASVRRWL
ncbi:MAG: isoprenylcysteine carboxylmethyltransferase family protein [Acidobacteriota bacterium]